MPSNQVTLKLFLKLGRTTGLTTGTIVDINVTQEIFYKNFNSLEQNYVKCRYDNLFAVEAKNGSCFSKPGDSGSLIFDEEGCAIALLVGGTEKITYALPIEFVFDELGVDLALF